MDFKKYNELKIQDLNLERPERPAIPFDPKEEITEADWSGAQRWLEILRTQRDFYRFALTAAAMKIAGGEVALTEKDLQEMQIGFNEKQRTHFALVLLIWFRCARILGREFVVSPVIREQIRYSYRHSANTRTIFICAVALKLLGEPLPLHRKAQKKIFEALCTEGERKDLSWGFLNSMAYAKLSGENVALTEDEWAELRSRLKFLREDNWTEFLELVYCMMILSAHRAWADKDGVHIELYPPEKPRKIPPPPVPRAF